MSRYAPSATVIVHPFTRQAEGEEIVIGQPETGAFLALPPDAVELLDALASGRTVGEALAQYQERHGEEPDLDGLLEHLEPYGFVGPAQTASGRREAPGSRRMKKRYHLTGISEPLARLLFGHPALVLYGLIIAAGLAALAARPSILPEWRSFIDPEHLTAMALGVSALALSTTALHELGHLVAARAAGISCTLGLGNRLWVLVAETDMTGVWALPRRQRYLPILAGPLVDAVSVSLLLLALFAESSGWLALPLWVARFARILVFLYLMRLLWQCYFFVRTDFYYAVATALGCKDLLRDTEGFLRNALARARRRPPVVDQSHIPAHERRVITAYSGIWLLGRAVAFSALLFIQVPLVIHYFPLIVSAVAAGFRGGTYAFLDSFITTAMSVVTTTLGFWFWFRELRASSRTPAR